MPKFKWAAVGADGRTVKGVQDAPTAGVVHRTLVAQELEPISVRERKGLLQLELTTRKVPRKELMHFSRQLAVFVRAGIPILEGLQVISEEMANKTFKQVLLDMIESLESGETFSSAAATHPEAFPPFYLGILRSAELTGNLDIVLDQLAEYIDRDLEARRRITSALVYPAMVLFMSVATVVVLTAFVLPRFESFFDNLDAELPLVTRVLLAISEFLGQWWYLFAGAALGLVLLYGFGVRTDRGRALRDRVLLRLPMVGGLVNHAILERFCRILSSMVQAGVPLPEAMSVTAGATNNIVYQRGLVRAREAMLRGEGLAAPLAATGLFPAAARQMFRVGENTGSLDHQLHTAAIYFDRELDYRIKRFTNLFEPAVIIFMGLIVGFVAIALVSAMYGIFRQVNT